MKLIHIKRKWNETRGDEFDHWGNSTWFFEAEKDGTVKRQVEEYTIGIRLRYDSEKSYDNYGMLSEVELDLSDSEFEAISETDFNNKWTERNPSLCQTIDDDKMTIQELKKIEISLPLSDKFYAEIWSTNLINKLQHLPMKYGPIQNFEETMILNEGLDSAIEIFESSKSAFSSSMLNEYESVLKFIKETKINGKALQFWL